MEEALNNASYEVKLDVFQGPLDLLLFLIKRDEVDIYDIPIARITGQYLHYLDLMKELNLEVAGEFLVMAATLIQIKLRMLLPVDRGEEGEAEEDPRKDLVRQLLEYQRFKKASAFFRQKEEEGLAIWFRPENAVEQFQKDGEILVEATIWNLIHAYQKIIDQVARRVPMEIEGEQYTIEDKMILIRTLLLNQEVLRLGTLFETVRSKLEAVIIFLAVLEMIRSGEIKVFQSANFGEMILYRKNLREVTNHGS